ncbi:MAG: glycoside hydrolase family 28 protein [Paludibacteraceae bacterium]|nr:glycoside hydrolase family 28 protein [Paludibacteraceae bacterium]
MKKLLTLLVASLAAFSLNAKNVDSQTIQQEVNQRLQNLPFASFSITVPTFADKSYDIRDFGAVPDGITVNTKAINDAIAQCSKNGGGTVIIPAGLWISGSITLQSNVNLYVAEGALLEFSGNKDDYDIEKTGKSYKTRALINGRNLKNVAITGRGIINGNGSTWRFVKHEKVPEKLWKKLSKNADVTPDGKRTAPKGYFAAEELQKQLGAAGDTTYASWLKVKTALRPYLLNVTDVENMLIEGVTFMNSPHITLKLDRIFSLTLKDVTVLNENWFQNSDGIDVSASERVLIYDCTVNTGDDGICMKSSLGNRGKRDKAQKFLHQNIVIRDCKVFHAHGGFVIGSNTDGGMNNIYVKNCTFNWTETGIRVKSGKGRGGRVQNIFCEDIFMKDIVDQAIIFELTYDDKGQVVKGGEDNSLEPDFEGFSIRNVYCDGAKEALLLGGTPKLNVRNVTIQNAMLRADAGVSGFRCDNITFDNVTVLPKTGVPFDFNKATNIKFINTPKPKTNGVFLKLKGSETKNISVSPSGVLAPSQVEAINEADPKQVKF